jgi:hypothetical protein
MSDLFSEIIPEEKKRKLSGESCDLKLDFMDEIENDINEIEKKNSGIIPELYK